MQLVRRAVLPLRVALVVLFGILTVFETLSLPGQFRHDAEVHPQDAPYRWLMTGIAVFCVLCAQVVVVATWKLLGLVKEDRVFTEAAHGWVDAIVGSVLAVWLVLAGVFVWVGLHADDPGAPMMLFLLTAAGAVFVLVLVVLRALLHQATSLRADLEAVI